MPKLSIPRISKAKGPATDAPKAGRRGRRTYVGLDVGSATIKAVQLTVSGRGVTVDRAVVVPTPPGAVEGGEFRDTAALTAALKGLFRKEKLKRKGIMAVLAGLNLIIRHAEFPQMPPAEMKKAVQWEAEQYIPIPVEDRVYDYIQVEDRPAGGSATNPILLVAAYKSPIKQFMEVMRRAGAEPEVIDIAPLAALRYLNRTAEPAESNAATTTTVVLDSGARTTILSIFRGSTLQVTRHIPVGGNSFTQAIAAVRGVDFAEAESLKRQHGVAAGSEIFPAVEPILTQLVGEVAQSIEFYLIGNRDQEECRVSLIGGNALMDGFAAAFDRELNARLVDRLSTPVRVLVRVGNENHGLSVAGGLAEQFGALEPVLANALGLGLREVGA